MKPEIINPKLNKKVTGSQFKGKTWQFFIDRIPDYFLERFNKPLILTSISDTLSCNWERRYGVEDIYNFIADVNGNPEAIVSIITSDKRRNFITHLPQETREYLLFKLNTQ